MPSSFYYIIHHIMIHRLKNKYGPDRLQAMKRYFLTLASHFLILIIPILLFSMAHGKDFNEMESLYKPLIDRLSQDGFDAEFLSKLMADPRSESIQAVMTISLNSGENRERYSQFLSPESIHLSKKFLRQNLKILRKAENRFHVEKEVAVSILLVESRFGENIGKYRVIPTLASMALIGSPENLQKNYSNLRETDPELSYEWVEDLAKRKAEWAYHELKCFLDIIRHEKMDPLEVYGSTAGAFGMAQFIPSSYLAYAHALNKNSFENWLLGKEEAIFSIGNYLRSHGWKKNLPIKKKKQVLWYYNRSEPYVETILKVAQKIKQ
jgi:membrane-bound lytic murein transglycosylase B